MLKIHIIATPGVFYWHQYGNPASSFQCYKWHKLGSLYYSFSSLITSVPRWSAPFCQWGLSSFTPLAATMANETWRAQLVLVEHYAPPTAASRATWSPSISKHHWLSCLQGLFLFYISFMQKVKKVGNPFWLRFPSISLQQDGRETGKGSDPNWASELFELSLSLFQICAQHSLYLQDKGHPRLLWPHIVPVRDCFTVSKGCFIKGTSPKRSPGCQMWRFIH